MAPKKARKKQAGKPRQKHSALVSVAHKIDIIQAVVSNKAAAEKAHVDPRTVRRWKRVSLAGGSYGGSKVGRKALVSSERRDELKLTIGQLVEADQAPQEEQLDKMIHSAVVATLRDRSLTEVAYPHVTGTMMTGNIDATQLEYEKGSQDIRVYHIKGEARERAEETEDNHKTRSKIDSATQNVVLPICFWSHGTYCDRNQREKH